MPLPSAAERPVQVLGFHLRQFHLFGLASTKKDLEFLRFCVLEDGLQAHVINHGQHLRGKVIPPFFSQPTLVLQSRA